MTNFREISPRFLGSVRPAHIVWIGALLIVAVILSFSTALLKGLKEESLKSAEADLSRLSLTLAEQADRSFKSLDLVMQSMVENILRRRISTIESFNNEMGGHETHQLLKEKLSGLPQVDAITVINAEGKLINFSRYWPIPEVNVSDRDYYKALKTEPSRETFVSSPVQNRGTGTWTIYIARRLTDPAGNFLGLVLGAMTLQYFEDFYEAVSPGDGSAVSLMRNDGLMLVRYPKTSEVGTLYAKTRFMIQNSGNGVFRDRSPIDGKMRVKAASHLTNYPLLILATQTEESLLSSWREVAVIVSVFAIGISALLLIAASLVTSWWRQAENALVLEQERSRAEKARIEAEASLARLREKAADMASEAKSSFVAVVSHEIRTPLNAIIGLTNALSETELSDCQRDMIKTVQLSSDSLMALLNDVLDYSRLEANGMEFEAVPFSSTEIMEATANICRPRALAKGLTLNIHHHPSVPETLIGDPGRIRQVLLNLLSNSVKFTDVGTVSISARLLYRGEREATVEWTVADTGIGIPREKIGSLFENFVQADTSINRRFGGTGLGLSICKRIVDKANGIIDVVSDPGRGSTFKVRLTLPVAQPIEGDYEEQLQEMDGFDGILKRLGHPLRVLVADDNSTNRLVLAKMLEGTGAITSMAADGMEAVAASRAFKFDVILMDIRMPEMDGIQATKVIRSDGNKTPIIAVTANVFSNDHAQFLAVGMQGVVAKPVRKAVLYKAIKECLPDLSGTRNDNGKGEVDKAARMDAPMRVVNEARYNSLLREVGEETFYEAIGLFVNDAQRRLFDLRGNDALSRRSTIQLHAHSIKGTASYFGFDSLMALSYELEANAFSITRDAYDDLVEKIVVSFEAVQEVLKERGAVEGVEQKTVIAA